ncbi:MAG: class I SAM-dependent methyltransferase [Deltaproteobacteria bacterium]|nr:class I SAM-dependent methyltransferase [Deltaproteobacteria bacterium]
MGRFATTVPYYSRYREPYPRAFFETIAKRLNFTGHERLGDIGCGPAPLAIGFASYVGSCTGVDPEPAMLAAARDQAAESGAMLNLIEARIEQLPETLERFDIITIGRALHWMEPQTTLRVLERIVAEGGSILICGASPPPGPSNPWLEPYNQIRNLWVDHSGEERYSADAEQRFAGSRFRFIERIVVSTTQSVTIEELVRRSLSRSTTSPQVLGERLAEFEQAITEAMRPFASDGVLREEIHASARIFR